MTSPRRRRRNDASRPRHAAIGPPCRLAFPEAPAPDAAAAEAGRRLFAGPVEFLKGVVAMSGLPPPTARRSVSRAAPMSASRASSTRSPGAALARASNTPGRTQEINYFTLGPSHYLVDLPGYGFANAPVAVVERWQALLKSYLAGRASLRRAFVLVDARHGIKPVDDEIMSLLDRAAVPFQCVLTKTDKIKAAARDTVLAQVRARLAPHPAAYPELILTSSEKGEGLSTLRATIAALGEEG